MRSNLYDLKAKLIHSTGKAFLFDFGLDNSVWIPKEACEWDEETETVTMTERYAISKGLDNLL